MIIKVTLEQLQRLGRGDKVELALDQIGNQSSDGVGGLGSYALVLDKPADVATGAEIRDFWDHGWDGDYFHDDWEEPVQDDMGEWILEPEKLYDLGKFGWCIWQGRGALPEWEHPAIAFVDAYRAWKNKK